jgi:hypothetical protein
MPPRKGKKGFKVVTDLSSFNQQEVKKQQEKEFHHNHKSNPDEKHEKGKAAVAGAAQGQGSAQAEGNKCEEEITKFQLNVLAQNTAALTTANVNQQQSVDFNIQSFYGLDNKLIDAYFSRLEAFSQEEERDLLED